MLKQESVFPKLLPQTVATKISLYAVALNENSTDFTPEGQFTSHEEYCSAHENSCIMTVMFVKSLEKKKKKSQFGLGEHTFLTENLC